MKNIKCKAYTIYGNDWIGFNDYLNNMAVSQYFVLVDENTEKNCLHVFLERVEVPVHVIKIVSGEANKTLETCTKVWTELLRKGADRHAMLINLGGGVIGDLGGFCAATYMRGIPYIQIPTTLLSQVDASVGGKLGVDFRGFKNMIGVISDPAAIMIHTDFLQTLPTQHIRSGYAELLKHGLIADKNSWQSLSKETDLSTIDFRDLVYNSILIKKEVTEKDPKEKGLRKILNFGHTIGHAVESYWMDSKTPLLHGEAIAIGMISESYLSYRLGNISEKELFDIRGSILNIYGHHPKYVKPVNDIMSIMKSDKKNKSGKIQFSLLQSVGSAAYDITVDESAIEDSFLFYKERLN